MEFKCLLWLGSTCGRGCRVDTAKPRSSLLAADCRSQTLAKESYVLNMKLIVGLGNPGIGYQNNRHNAGFMAVDYLCRALGQFTQWHLENKFKSELSVGQLGFETVMFLKPQTFMNSSGEAVQAVSSFYKVASTDILVIHDDLDLKLGVVKLQQGVGPKVHNGLLNIEEKLGTKKFWRLRLGVDARSEGGRAGDQAGEKYSLADFPPEEKRILTNTLEITAKKITEWLSR